MAFGENTTPVENTETQNLSTPEDIQNKKNNLEKSQGIRKIGDMISYIENSKDFTKDEIGTIENNLDQLIKGKISLQEFYQNVPEKFSSTQFPNIPDTEKLLADFDNKKLRINDLIGDINEDYKITKNVIIEKTINILDENGINNDEKEIFTYNLNKILNGEITRKQFFNNIGEKTAEFLTYENLGFDFEKAIADFESNDDNFDEYSSDIPKLDNIENAEEIISTLKKLYQPGKLASTIDYHGLKQTYGEEIAVQISQINLNNKLTPQEKFNEAKRIVLTSKGKILEF